MPDVVVAGLRAISFVAVFQAAGIAIFLSLYGGSLVKSAVIIRSLGIGAAVTGCLFTLAQHLVQPVRMTGSLSGIFDGSLQNMLLNSDVGTTSAIRLLGLLILVVGLRKTSRMGEAVSLIGATLVVVSFGLMGHSAAHDQRWALIVLLLVHLLIIAFWFGALMPLYVAAIRETVETNARVIENFSAAAAWLVPVIFVAGLGMSVVLLEELSNLWTPYGVALLAKITGFGLLMGLATLNKWRLGPAIAAGNTASLAIFRRSVVAEWCLIVGVLTVTAAMTLLFSPTHG
jgi:putative copper resistance protein D